jgi:hypothetical protein
MIDDEDDDDDDNDDDDDDDDDDCGAIDGIRICRGNRSTRIKPSPVLLFHQKSHMT